MFAGTKKLGVWALLVCALAAGARAERLPVRTYTTADGLAHDRVRCVMRDTRGFLWIGTGEGMSRFDGYRFANYGPENGLPGNTVNDILETRSGWYWVATIKGAARFNPTGATLPRDLSQPVRATQPLANAGPTLTRFESFTLGNNAKTNVVKRLPEDHRGRLWAGTGDGLFLWNEAQSRFERFNEGPAGQSGEGVVTLLEDANGHLWVGRVGVLLRIWPDGRMTEYTMASNRDQTPTSRRFLTQTTDGLLWFLDLRGLVAFRPDEAMPTEGKSPVPWRTLSESNQAPGPAPAALASGAAHLYRFSDASFDWGPERNGLWATPDGRLWVGSNLGAFWYKNGVFHRYTKAEGLSDNTIVGATEDLDGNIWLATFRSGVCKIVHNGFSSYGPPEGLANARIIKINEDSSGALITSSDNWTASRFDGRGFVALQPSLGAAGRDEWFFAQNVLRDHLGAWWVPTGRGLFRFAATASFEQLAQARPLAVYTVRDGLPGNYVMCLTEDGQGNIWLVCQSNTGRFVARWERATGQFRRYTEADGVPLGVSYNLYSDTAGRVWLGFEDGKLGRYADGRWRVWGKSDGVPAGAERTFYQDRAGRLWVGTSLGGLLRIDQPGADNLAFKSYTTADGLSSNNVRAITEDEWGRLYLGLGRGVERLDFSAGALAIKRYTTADGLANSFVNEAFRDSRGQLWFGTLDGLSRLTPEMDAAPAPAQVFISGLRAGGAPYLNSDLGASVVQGPELSADANRLQIDFFGLSFSSGEILRYQYKLDGYDQEWSPLTDQRSFNASLAPGRYNFLVRVVSAAGTASAPAQVSFRILPPVWQRWWFITLSLAVLGGLGWRWASSRARRLRDILALQRAEQSLNQSRAERLADIERVRRRIATDLHDDIGSSLTQIAILSEVVRQRTQTNAAAAEPLELIAAASRELVDSMSDIVWAINPEKDHLRDLTQRMRRFASDVFATGDIVCQLRLPDSSQEVKLGANMRREVFLIFKESIHNLVRHSAGTEAKIIFTCSEQALRLELRDNGKGFDPAGESDGHGLASMRERARAINGTLAFNSQPGQGTTVTLHVPLETTTVK